MHAKMIPYLLHMNLIDLKGDLKPSQSTALEALVNCEFILEVMKGYRIVSLKNSALEQLKLAKVILGKCFFLSFTLK